MVSKITWPLILGAGTTVGGGVTFMLPESLWSDAHTIVIYKKGNEKDDTSVLKVGGGKEKKYGAHNPQNTESIVRVGVTGWEDQSSNMGDTQNNSFWLVGSEHHQNSSSYWKQGMNKGGKSSNPKGSLSLYLLKVTCDSLKKENKFKLNSEKAQKVKLSCQSKFSN